MEVIFMSVYLVGFITKKGDFINKDTGESINYNNRVLQCVSDSPSGTGYEVSEIKLKMSDISISLGVPQRDDAVDMALTKLFKQKINFVMMPKNGVLSIVGISPIN